MSEPIEGLRNKFRKWKEAFESKGLKTHLGKTEVMVSGGIANDGLSKYYPFGIFGLGVNVYSVLCLQCVKQIHSRCARVKRVTPRL